MQQLTGTEITMIDVNHWEGDVDWQKVAEDGVKAAYMKATEGLGMIDETADGHLHWATTFGIECGAYHFGHPESNDPIAEADFFLSVVSGKNYTLMPVLDLEYPTDSTKFPLSSKFVSEWARAWVNHVQEKTGRRVMVYTGKWYTDMYGVYGLNDQPLWMSRYSTSVPDDAAGWTQWTAWQYTDKGHINGVIPCDMSYAISLEALRGGNAPVFSAPVQSAPQPAPVVTSISGVLTVLVDVLNVRSGAGTSYAVVSQVHKGEKYKVYAEQDGWYNVGGNQWVSGNTDYTSFQASFAGAGQRVECIVSSLRFYDKPSWADQDVAGTVTQGLGFTIDDKVQVENGYQYKVHNSNGATYYITANPNYVQVK